MMHFPYGNNLKIYVEGESRGEYLTAIFRHFPRGFRIDTEELSRFMSRRAPGIDPFSTARREDDSPVFLSGVRDGVTDGTPIEIRIYNRDAVDGGSDYSLTPRPSHADYAAYVRYGGREDIRGGGHFSGRLTAPLCVCGGLCLQYLNASGITVSSHLYSVGGINDIPFDPLNPPDRTPEGFPCTDKSAADRIKTAILRSKSEGDSLGGIIECAVKGLPAGLGEHMFASAEARISSAVFSIPGVRGIEFGAGFGISSMHGSEANDPFVTDGHAVSTSSNNSGGINGGMTNGMPVIFRAAFRPTPSIAVPQKTVDIRNMTSVGITVSGRNDPCYVQRAVPVVEACAAIAVTDMLLDKAPAYGTDGLRRDIDIADRKIADALSERFRASDSIGEIKKVSCSPVFVPSREKQVISYVTEGSDGSCADEIKAIYESILGASRSRQRRISPLYRAPGISGGLIGKGLGHTLSPEIHARLADYGYSVYDIEKDDIPGFIKNTRPDFFNVTIPYKKKIIPFLDAISAEAGAVGAVNTVVRDRDGKLKGFNTDVFGFRKTVEKLLPDGPEKNQKVFVIGHGGAACAVDYVFTKYYGIKPIYFTRHPTDNENISDFPRFAAENDYILVNASPCGMYPDTDDMPVPADSLGRCRGVIDLIYNPFRTALILECEKMNIPTLGGMTMLVYQAAKTCDVVLGTGTDDESAARIISEISGSFGNIVLTGMPGCGKTTVGRRLAEVTGRRFFDTDEDIVLRTGRSCADYIRKFGEEAFRREEHISAVSASRLHEAVIAVGGGAVTNPDNYLPMKSSGTVVWLRKPLSQLDVSDRPVTQAVGLPGLLKVREPLYRAFSDVCADIGDDVDENVLTILNVISCQ